MSNRKNTSGRVAVSLRKKLQLAKNPLEIFTGRLFGYWTSRQTSTNCLTSSTSIANAAWTKNGLSAVDGYADPLGGTGASLFTNDTGNSQHRAYQTYVLPTGVNLTAEVYIKAVTPNQTFTFSTNTVVLRVNSTTGAITTQSNCGAKIDVLSNNWFKIKITYATAAADTAFRLYCGIENNFTGAGEQIYVYLPTLDNQQPISIPDLSGNNRTFTQNTAGGIVKRDNNTIAQFGQQSVYLAGAQGYISTSPPNEDYTSISIVGTLNGNYNNNCAFEVANADATQRFVSYYSNNGVGTQQNADIYYRTPTQGIQDLKILPAAPAGMIGVFYMYNPLTGSVVSKYNNTSLTSSKTGTNVANTKMSLGNSVAFNLTGGLYWFESLIVKGAITAADEIALKEYIKENYNQNVY